MIHNGVTNCLRCQSRISLNYRITSLIVCCHLFQTICPDCLAKVANQAATRGIECMGCGTIVNRQMLLLKYYFYTNQGGNAAGGGGSPQHHHHHQPPMPMPSFTSVSQIGPVTSVPIVQPMQLHPPPQPASRSPSPFRNQQNGFATPVKAPFRNPLHQQQPKPRQNSLDGGMRHLGHRNPSRQAIEQSKMQKGIQRMTVGSSALYPDHLNLNNTSRTMIVPNAEVYPRPMNYGQYIPQQQQLPPQYNQNSLSMSATSPSGAMRFNESSPMFNALAQSAMKKGIEPKQLEMFLKVTGKHNAERN